MKKNKNELDRIQRLIKTDRMSVKENFNELLTSDLNNVFRDYFDYKGKPILKIEKNGDALLVSVSLFAMQVKTFLSLPKSENF